MRIIYLISLLLAFFGVHANTTEPMIVEAKYALDSNSSWKVSDLRTKSFLRFATDNNLNIGFNTNSNVWCVFKIKNKDKLHAKKTWLCFENNHIDSLVFYDHGIKKYLGDRTIHPSRFMESQAYEISLEPNEERTCLFRLKKGISFFQFSFRLDNEAELIQKSNLKIALVSFILGTIFLLIVFNFLLLYLLRDKLYGYYILYA
ncbi:MAG: 7TM-DISM domain-containing protein, partial [Flavobacterium sp.]